MTDRVEIISKEIDGHMFTGLRFYLELPTSLPKEVFLSGPSPAVHAAYAEPPNDATRNVKGPFMHRPGDDDSAAVTFWGKQDLRVLLRKALAMLDLHYRTRECKSCRGLGCSSPVPSAFNKTCSVCNGTGRVSNEPASV
jgi:hypothetical protein